MAPQVRGQGPWRPRGSPFLGRVSPLAWGGGAHQGAFPFSAPAGSPALNLVPLGRPALFPSLAPNRLPRVWGRRGGVFWVILDEAAPHSPTPSEEPPPSHPPQPGESQGS